MSIRLNANIPLARLPDGEAGGVKLGVALGRADDADQVGANITRDQATDAFLESGVKRGPIDRLLQQPGQLDRFLAPQ